MENSVILRAVEELTTICFKVKPADLALLVALEDHEDLKRSDVLRRAIRAYAAQLNVTPADPRRVRAVQKARSTK